MKLYAPLSWFFSVSVALLVMLVTAAISIAASRTIEEVVREQVGRQLTLSATQAADRLDQFIWARQSEVELFRDIIERGDRDAAATGRLLTLVQRTLPMFAWLGYADSQGIVQAASDGILEGASIAERPVFYEALTGRFIGDVHDAVLLARLLPSTTGEPMRFVDVSFPVRDAQGNVEGVVATHINWEWIREVRQEFLVGEAVEQRDLSVIDSLEGMYVLGAPEKVGRPADPRLIDAALRGRDYTILREGSDQSPAMISGLAVSDGHRDFVGFPWVTVVSEPLDVALAGVSAQQRSMWGIGITIALAAAAVGYLASHGMARALRKLSRQADALRLGGREIEVVNSRISEFHELGASFQYLSSELSRTEYAAHTDPLTGMFNRMGSEGWMERSEALCRRNGKKMVIMALDLDGFKTINDTHGHPAGDAVLHTCAQRLKAILRPDELASRWGGDEFLVCVFSEEEAVREVGETVGQRILTELSQPISYGDITLQVGCSIGLSLCDPAVPGTWKDAYHAADQALYVSKRHGKHRWSWDGESI
jgi:diguanylate cyclase (GGDEF)-like protein